jgi:sucrose-6-phosphate hydrolase SacC (GH32 family)
MSVPRELTVRGDRLRQTPAREVRLLRGAERRTNLGPSEAETIALEAPLAAFELLLDVPVEAIELRNDDTGAEFTIQTSKLTGSNSTATEDPGFTVYFDDGIVEAFYDGNAATWTHLALATVTSIRVTPRPGADHVAATLWLLKAPRRD